MAFLYLKFKRFYYYFQFFKKNMGGSSNRIKVAIIDQSQRQQDFDSMKNEDSLKIAYYKSLEAFLQNQSLKKLSYIVIREKQEDENEQRKVRKEENSIISKRMDNIMELTSEFQFESIQKTVTVREKLIAYIKKFSLQKLVIYLYIKDALDYKLPDYEVPYISLISDKLSTIIDHLKTKPKREEPAIFKFKRLVKDLYRRSTVRILEIKPSQDASDSQWKQLLKKKKIAVDFAYNVPDFQASLISNYNDYIIVSTPQMLTYILDAKKQFEFDSKIIYFGEEEEVMHKNNAIWMVSKGRSKQHKEIIVKTIKKCSDLITDKSSARPKLTIIFTTNHYTKEEKQFVKTKAVECLKKATKQQDKSWIDQMQIVVTSNYERLKNEIKKFVYTYLITFDCTIPQTEDLKAWLKKNNYGNRVYIYNLELKQDKGAKANSQDQNQRMKKIAKNVETMVTKAGFKIKFEIGPLDSIALFEMSDKEYKYFSSKLGLVTTMINEEQWNTLYCKNNRVRIIDSYYIVCHVQTYFNKLRHLIAAEASQKNSYFNELRVVIYDKREAIRKRWNDISDIPSIAFVHYSFSKIQDFLDIAFVPSLKLSIFVKKALPQYIQAVKGVEQSKCRSLILKGITVSQNDLLKEVFEENVLTSSDFQLNFKHYSITNRNLQESIKSLYTFIAKFANLWRVGYDIIKDNQDKVQVINTLRDDLKACLYKCKSYSLLEISDEEFDYFYIKRLDLCQTFLDLQIAIIYMVTLPHGFSKILQQIFSRPKQSCMIPKVFSAFIVILLTAFCSVEDEVMGNKSLVVYLDDTDIDKKINGLNIGDTIFNASFIPSGKNQSVTQNQMNHCIFLEFEDIPMLSDTFIKNYLYIQRFSFYKQTSEYLVAPYTRFTVKNKILTANGKYHIFLHAANDQQKGFPQAVFKANSINDKELFKTIKQEINTINDDENLRKMTQEVSSLYKRSQIISLYEEKLEMVKSINDSLQYKNFMNAKNKGRYLSALSHLNLKQRQQKATTQIQAHYFKAMLGVEKSLVYFRMNEFDKAITYLEKVEAFLGNQEDNSSWVLKSIQQFKKCMDDLSTKRHKLFNRALKTKKWKIFAERQANNRQKTSFSPVVVMQQEEYTWSNDYLPQKQEYYITNINESQHAFLPYKIKQNFGQYVVSFTNDMVYEKSDLQTMKKQDKQLDSYTKYQVNQRLAKDRSQVSIKEIEIKRHHSTSPQKTKQKDDKQEQQSKKVVQAKQLKHLKGKFPNMIQ